MLQLHGLLYFKFFQLMYKTRNYFSDILTNWRRVERINNTLGILKLYRKINCLNVTKFWKFLWLKLLFDKWLGLLKKRHNFLLEQ